MIHDEARVAESVVLGESTSIWQGAVVREGARIGTRTTVGMGAYIGSGVVVWDRCKVQNYACVYEPASLGDGVFVGPGAILTNDHHPRAVNPDGSLKGISDWDAVGVVVGEGASIGAHATCVAPVRIGRWAMVAAGSVVTRDVPDFALVAGALAGLQSFSVGAFVEIYSAPIYLAAAGITVYLGGVAVGILFGGELADRLRYPTAIACTSLALAAMIMACVGWLDLPMTVNIGLLAIIGFCSGVSQPSRDILVKSAAPAGASGKTFGFVYSGLDFGGAIGPIAFGWLMDGGHHRWVFLGTALLFAVAVFTVLQLSKGSRQ